MKLKRVTALLLCFCMIFGILPIVHAEDNQEEQVQEETVESETTVEESFAVDDATESTEEEEREQTEETTPSETEIVEETTEAVEDEPEETVVEEMEEDSEIQMLAEDDVPLNGNYAWFENLPIESSGRYTGNEGDSFISTIGTRNGKSDIYGTTFEHGLEVWIARWNFIEEFSWAWATYRLNGTYQVLSGTLSILAGSYNKTDFNTTLEIIGDDEILFSATLTPNMEPIPIHLDLSGVEIIKISAYDNKKVRGGTSFALGDLRLTNDGNEIKKEPVYPEGYDFIRDSYNFGNYISPISKKYFTTLYEDSVGEALYKIENRSGLNGLCFGMSNTTAAIYNGYPMCSSIENKKFLAGENCENIRDISSESKVLIGNNKIQIQDYIKYVQIYQYSASFNQNRILVLGENQRWVDNSDAALSDKQTKDLYSFFDYVKSYIDNEGIGLVIWLTDASLNSDGKHIRKENGEIQYRNHVVLAVGYDENHIYCDDSNTTANNRLEYITIGENGEWSYSDTSWTVDGSINDKTSFITFSLDYFAPYLALKKGVKAVVASKYGLDEYYIEGGQTVDNNKILVFINSLMYTLRNMKYVSVFGHSSSKNDEYNDNGDIYWVDQTSPIELDGFNGNDAEIIIANDGRTFTVEAEKLNSLSGKVESNQIKANIQSQNGSKISINVDFFNDNNKTSVIFSDAIVSGEIAVEFSEDNTIVVEGLLSGKVQLAVDEKIVNEKCFSDATEELNISFDQSGETDTLVISNEQEQPHEHVYDQEIATEKFMKEEVSCSAPATYYKSCVCGEAGTDTFTSGKPLSHTEAIDKAIEATCTEAGKTEGKHCSVCGTVIVAQVTVNVKGHTVSDWKHDNEAHWQICERCSLEIEGTRGTHLDENGDKLCDVCGRSVVAEHKHSFHWIGYNKDKNGHTVRCDCGESHVEAHSKNLAGRCNICGYAVSGPSKATETIVKVVTTIIRIFVSPLGKK